MLTINEVMLPRWIDHDESGSRYKVKSSSGLFKLSLAEMVHGSNGSTINFNKEAISFCLKECLLDWSGIQDKDGNEIKWVSPDFALAILPSKILSHLISEIYKHTFYLDGDLAKKS